MWGKTYLRTKSIPTVVGSSSAMHLEELWTRP
jgi:hypothetical protein